MRSWIAAVLLAATGTAGAQSLFDYRDDLGFTRESVESFARRDYQRRLDLLRESGRLDANPALSGRLAPLFARVLAAAEIERPGFARLACEIHTCSRCGETAFAAAHGRLMVGEEWVARLDLSDDELAFLLAHEIAHVLAEHSREFAGAARYFVDNGLRREYWDIQRELDASLVAQYRMAFIAQQQELEADRIALFLGARAGFDPAAMASLIAKLAVGETGPGPGTHPAHQRRLAQVRAAQSAAAVLHARAAWDREADR
jgi:hypothetical protein